MGQRGQKSWFGFFFGQVEDPSKYGVVVTDDSGKVERFVEKPKVRSLFCAPSHLSSFSCCSGICQCNTVDATCCLSQPHASPVVHACALCRPAGSWGYDAVFSLQEKAHGEGGSGLSMQPQMAA